MIYTLLEKSNCNFFLIITFGVCILINRGETQSVGALLVPSIMVLKCGICICIYVSVDNQYTKTLHLVMLK